MLEETFVPNRYIKLVDKAAYNTIDCREGVLLDSYIADDDSGETFIAFEAYENPNCSGYLVVRGPEQELWERWEQFTEGYDKEYSYE